MREVPSEHTEKTDAIRVIRGLLQREAGGHGRQDGTQEACLTCYVDVDDLFRKPG